MLGDDAWAGSAGKVASTQAAYLAQKSVVYSASEAVAYSSLPCDAVMVHGRCS